MAKIDAEELKKAIDCYGLDRGKVYILRLDPEVAHGNVDALYDWAKQITEIGKKEFGLDLMVLPFEKGSIEIIPSYQDVQKMLEKYIEIIKKMSEDK